MRMMEAGWVTSTWSRVLHGGVGGGGRQHRELEHSAQEEAHAAAERGTFPTRKCACSSTGSGA